MKRSAAVLACAVAVAGCGGGSSGGDPPGGRTGGAQADERLADELGAKRAPLEVPLELCDGRRVEVVQVAGEDALDAWRELRAEAGASGLWPVMIGSPEDAAILAEMVGINCDDGHTSERTLMRAARVDVERALARVARAYGVSARDLRGSTPLPDEPPADDFLTPLDVVTQEPLPEVLIARLPVDESWQAPALLSWGNYNDNPPPAVHTAVLRDWSERYGAELVAMTGDVLELAVERPPATDAAALALAREQYRYSPDIVQQGVGDVEALAALLKNGHAWYFWWD